MKNFENLLTVTGKLLRFSDFIHVCDGESGTGTSFIYYDNRAGNVEKFNPNINTNYALYKSASHILLAMNFIGLE